MTGQDEGAPDDARGDFRLIVLVYGCLAFAAIFLQKFGLTFGSGSVDIDTPIIWTGLAALALSGRVEIVKVRLALLVLLLNAVAVSFIVAGGVPKLTSFGVMLAMYAGLIFRVRVPLAVALRCVRCLQRMMVVVALVVLAQQVSQYAIGNRIWPNLDKLMPAPLLYPGFMYIRPYSWNSPYLEPNGIFFLEPSALSYYLGASSMIEIIWLKNLRRLSLYAAAMLACLAGTGPTDLLVTLPFWLPRLGKQGVRIMIASLPLLALAYSMGWLDHFVARSTELKDSNSSGFARFMLPLQTLLDHLQPSFILSGLGPGTSVKGLNVVQWPFSKLLTEYGLLTAIAFHVFVLVSVIGRAPDRTLMLVLLVPWLCFGGGFVAPTEVMLFLLLGSLIAIDERPQIASPVPGRRRREAAKLAIIGSRVAC